MSIKYLAIILSFNALCCQIAYCSNRTSDYIIDGSVDLNGRSLRLDSNQSLIITSTGELKNGIIIGSNSQIKTSNNRVLNNITVKGSWNMVEVRSSWFSCDNDSDCNQLWRNLMTLCAGSRFTHLYTEADTFNIKAVNKGAPIMLPSNVYWHNSSIIKLLPCNYKHYSIVYLLNSENVTIDGGVFIGDAINHIEAEGEWGHGIKLGGAKNITLKNLECSYCWGDGIDLIEGMDDSNDFTVNCVNVTIKNVKCSHNRRQGLSIEAAENINVSNSDFSFTGNPLYTAPGAGIDIEPWTGPGIKIKDITVDKCKFTDNVGPDIRCHTYYRPSGIASHRGEVVMKNCNMGKCELINSNGVKIDNCNIANYLKLKNSESIELYNCKIQDYEQLENCNSIELRKCKISDIDNISTIGVWTGIGTLLLACSMKAFTDLFPE